MNGRAWYSDESFWQTFYGCLFNAESFARAAQELRGVRELTGVSAGAVLDLGCGPGRHAVPLAQAGFEVTALDLSPWLLARASEYAGDLAEEIHWQQGDMREFEWREAFDLALSMWTTFGYFEDPADDIRVLENIHRSLKPGGKVVLDMVGKEYLCRNLAPVHLREFDNGDLLVERPLLEANMTKLSNEWILISDKQIHRARWSHHVYSGRELADRLAAAGFIEIQLYGDLGGGAYELDSERLVAVAARAVR